MEVKSERDKQITCSEIGMKVQRLVITKRRRGFLLFNKLRNDKKMLVNDEVMNMQMIQNYLSYFSKSAGN